MSTITKVALAGATGNVGPAVLDELLKAGFKVTALTRKDSSHTFPSSVSVANVDYESLESLTQALKGHDAVISTLPGAAPQTHLLIEAAVQAGVKRFIPSEFGSDSTNEKVARLAHSANKVAVQKALKEKAAEGSSGLTYTFIITGPFFDWGLEVGIFGDVKGRKVTFYDGGDRKFSTTLLSHVGQAVAGVLRKPEETRNRTVYVQSTALSHKELLEKVKRVVGTDGWTEEFVSVDEMVKAGWKELKKDKPNPLVFIKNFIPASIYGEDMNQLFAKLDNELLDIPQLTEDEVQGVVDRCVKE